MAIELFQLCGRNPVFQVRCAADLFDFKTAEAGGVNLKFNDVAYVP